jgi:hypothetical protein
MLTNPANIGWLIINGDIISTNNHDPIVPPEKTYLFWYAFDHLSEYTVQGEINQKRSIAARRFNRRQTTEEVGLLKNRIEAENGNPVYVHLSEGTDTYRTPKQETKIYAYSESEIEVTLIDSAFTERLFAHLRETHDFDIFRQWVGEVIQKQTTQREIILTQLGEIEQQQEAILDEKLAIRTHINQQIKEARTNDPTADIEQLKIQFEREAAKDLERLQKRSAKLEEREKDLQAKLPSEEDEQHLQIARTLADFQTEIENLAENMGQKTIQREKRVYQFACQKSRPFRSCYPLGTAYSSLDTSGMEKRNLVDLPPQRKQKRLDRDRAELN